MQNVDLSQVQRRVRGYWYEDGLVELGTAAVFALVALLFVVRSVSTALPPLAGTLALVVLVLASSLVAHWGISAAKRRLTYPRSGYVRYPPSGWPRRALSAALGLAAAVLLAIALRALPEALLPETLLEGAAIATFLVYLGAVSGTPRFFALAAVSLAAGALAAWALGDALAGSALVFGVLALALAASGGAALRSYVRSAPEAAQRGA